MLRHSWPLAPGLLLAVLAGAAAAAPPAIPEALSYQGVLLDDQGLPRTGSVDLTLRLYDAVVGGTLLYKQILPGVPLDSGVFTIVLGPIGSATDSPANPLTTSLAQALAGDLAATSPGRFLEVTVGSGGALARTQILAAPFALRAQTAQSADTALDVSSVNGLSPTFVTEVFEHTNLDGQGPGNSDPSEGLGDVDADAIANFVDPDNDNDTLLDSVEVGQGSDMNLVTPIVTGFSPSSADGFVTTTVTVQGANFAPGLSVLFGSQTPVPANVTPTSFQVDVGPQSSGSKTVVVTLPNGQSDSASFSFFQVFPNVFSLQPPSAPGSLVTRVTLNGSGFVPPLSVVFGSQTPTALNATSTSFEVDVGPQVPGLVDVQVTNANGASRSFSNVFEFLANLVHEVVLDPDTQLSFDVKGSSQTVLGGLAQYGVDVDANGSPETIVPLATRGSSVSPGPGQLAVGWDAAGALVGLRCRAVGSDDCSVELLRDADADFDLEDETGAAIETLALGANPRILAPSLDFDPAGRALTGYVRFDLGTAAVVAHDRDGDGAFGGTNEHVVIEANVGTLTDLAEVAASPGGELAFVYFDDSGDLVRVAWDRSGDGDFSDAPGGNPELFTLATLGGPPDCLGAGFAPDGDLAVIWDDGTSPKLARDLDTDGDFASTGEIVALAASSGSTCDVEGGGAFLAAVHNAGGDLRLLADRNDDGDFADADENLVILQGISSVQHVRVGRNASGQALTATTDKVLFDPLP